MWIGEMNDTSRKPAIPLTRLLQQWREGDDGAMDRIAPMIYKELHRRAGAQMVKERCNHTLSPTDLVHEAYLKLVGERERDFKNRLHFFALASRVMREVLIQYARSRKTRRRGGDREVLICRDVDQLVDPKAVALIPDLAESVEILADKDARKARVVEMHYFAGLGIDEIAEALQTGSATVKRDLHFARAWLRKHLEEKRP